MRNERLRAALMACAPATSVDGGRPDTQLGGATLSAAGLTVALALTSTMPRTACAQDLNRQSIGTFSIDRIEVTIRAPAFAKATGLVPRLNVAGAASSGPAVAYSS